MFQTSSDILNLTLSICVVALTIFLCWGIYYGIRIVKGIFEIIDELQKTIERVENMVNETKSKIENFFSATRITTDAIKGVLEYFSQRKKKKDIIDNDE